MSYRLTPDFVARAENACSLLRVRLTGVTIYRGTVDIDFDGYDSLHIEIPVEEMEKITAEKLSELMYREMELADF